MFCCCYIIVTTMYTQKGASVVLLYIPVIHLRNLIYFSVTDGVYSDTSVLNVTIKDVNDNEPYFLNPSYSVDIAETAGYGRVCCCHDSLFCGHAF